VRAIKNLIREVELITDFCDPAWPPAWGAEVLGRAIGHELRWELRHGEPQRPPVLASFIDPSLDKMLIGYHIADVL